MFFRVTTMKRSGRVLKYGYLVESYRRESDGQPRQRTLCKLGLLTEQEVANFRVSFDALRRGAPVVVLEDDMPLPQAIANLDYLGLAVLLETWKGWQLSELIDQLIADDVSDLAPSTVIAALTYQRCLAPRSKLDAVRWVPTTALPELLAIGLNSWNNSRIHRVLDQLAAVDTALQQGLCNRYRRRDGAFVALHIDTTDAVFVGAGPPQAERSRWKDGALKRRIGIALLCNEHGYPLRWKVVNGRAADCNTFIDIASELSDQTWAQNVPVIIDRAAGSTATIEELLTTGLHILTPLRRNEFPAYAPNLPTTLFDDLKGEPEQLRLGAIERAKSAFERVDDSLFVLDLGERRRTAKASPCVRTCAPDDAAIVRDQTLRVKRALELARAATEAVQAGRFRSFAAFGRHHGISKGLLTKYRLLLRLSPAFQDALANDQLVGLSLERLTQIAKGPEQEQATAIQAFLAPQATPEPGEPDPPVVEHPLVRCVVYFNPDILVTKRVNAAEKLARVRKAVADLNVRLCARTRTEREICAAVDRLLQAEGLLHVFSSRVDTIGKGKLKRRQVVLKLDTDEWQRRRQFDGFSVLIGHPKLGRTARELSQLYRKRACIEHDFRIIKSFIEICPVHHRIERKVRAHVTICMLALLLERTLSRQLAAAHLEKPTTTSHHSELTAPAALEVLQTCHLDQFHNRGYSMTQTTADQNQILAALSLEHLADNGAIANRITPR